MPVTLKTAVLASVSVGAEVVVVVVVTAPRSVPPIVNSVVAFCVVAPVRTIFPCPRQSTPLRISAVLSKMTVAPK